MSKSIMDMTETSWQKAFIDGFMRGLSQGRFQTLVASVDKIIKKLGLSVQEACDVEYISVEICERLKTFLQAEER